MRALAARGYITSLHTLGDAPDVVVFGKRYGTTDLEYAQTLRAKNCKVVLDMCDNMLFSETESEKYAAEGRKLTRMLRSVDRVICSTPTLAEFLKAGADLVGDVAIVNDPFEPISLPARQPGSAFGTFLWFGRAGVENAPGNGIADIAMIAPVLEAWHARHPFRLVVCSDNRTTFETKIVPLAMETTFIAWKLDSFPAVLAQADAVIIPISVNDFTRCKTHNRLSLALGAGIPTLATGIPSYRDLEPFCYLDDWDRGLRAVLEANQSALAKAKPARAWLDKHLNIDVIADQWEKALAF